ncbi:MAG: HU family DNA-binding protein [Kiritimatiellia bacterium]|jgi:nucleoid DNA-binding protein/predicted RNA-binding Zn-ribbon protein involved in translation (DUF1610 family)
MSKPKSMTKAGIIAALADKTGLSRADVDRVLANLAELAYSEAVNGFTIPGLCKFKVVRRKQSRRFNPVTRMRYLVAEHDVLKVIPLKKAKERIAPLPENLIIREIPPEPVPEPTPEPVPESAPESDYQIGSEGLLAPVHDPAPESVPVPAPEKEIALPDTHTVKAESVAAASDEQAITEAGGIIFACPHCGNTIMAQVNERGQTAECPVCNGQMVVPDTSAASAAEPAAKPKTVSNFVAFVCEVCRQEIEAPLEMIGMSAVCPACGSQLRVPAHETEGQGGAEDDGLKKQEKVDRSSMTIRMDLSDLVE